MSTKDPLIGNKLLSSLRVVDLKEELEKRGLPKSGTKKDLAERLRNYVLKNEQPPPPAPPPEEMQEDELPSISVQEKQMLAEKNPFLRDYFSSQAALYHTQKVHKQKLLEEEARKETETETQPPEKVEEPKRQRQSSQNGDSIPTPVVTEPIVKDKNQNRKPERMEQVLQREIRPPVPEAAPVVRKEIVTEEKLQKDGAAMKGENKAVVPEQRMPPIATAFEEPKAGLKRQEKERSPSKREEVKHFEEDQEDDSRDQTERSPARSEEKEYQSESEDKSPESEESGSKPAQDMRKVETFVEPEKKEEHKDVESPKKEVRKERIPPVSRTERLSSGQPQEEEEEEVLDYGEEEKLQSEPPKFDWVRRILRLTNSQASRGPPTWNRDAESKLLENINSEFMLQWFSDVKLPTTVEFKEEKPVRTPEDHDEGDVKISRTFSLESDDGTVTKVENITITRRVTAEPPEEEGDKDLSPARNPPSELILVSNLTRPFTLPQLRELLSRTGSLQDLWVDKIKSKCIAKYEKEEEAFETRAALHGIKWPQSNPKALHVDYTTQEVLQDQKARESGEVKPSVIEPLMNADVKPVREWDVGKRGRSRSPGRKRSRSGSPGRDRKRSRRSPSPGRRRHSRSPHHDRRRGEAMSEPTGKALDELFRKTVTTPSIYWLPLTAVQIAEKEERRRQRMIERDRRLAELNRPRPR